MASPTPAYGYVRVSGKGQIGGHGPERQRAAIKRYAKAHKLRLVEFFTDAGVSGTNELADRPGLGRLLHAVETNGVRTVLIERLDRLARDLVVQELIVADLRKHDVELISATEGPDLDSDDPSRKLVRQIMGAVAEYDKTVLVLKLAAAREAKRKADGKCEGRKAYGEVDPREAEAVERIRQFRDKRRTIRDAEGRVVKRSGQVLGYRRIAQQLDREGYPTRQGGPWSRSTVSQIVKGQQVGQRKGARSDRLSALRAPGTHSGDAPT